MFHLGLVIVSIDARLISWFENDLALNFEVREIMDTYQNTTGNDHSIDLAAHVLTQGRDMSRRCVCKSRSNKIQTRRPDSRQGMK